MNKIINKKYIKKLIIIRVHIIETRLALFFFKISLVLSTVKPGNSSSPNVHHFFYP
jgi:hypothetical protein